MPAPTSSPRLKATASGFIGCLGLAVVLTWPAALDLGGGLVGHPGNDVWNHAWGYWWVAEGLLERGGVPLHTRHLNFPDGGSLYFIDLANAVLAAPLVGTLGVATAYNLLVLFSFTWTAFGAWLLAQHVLDDGRGAAVAAVIYGASPHLLGQAHNGITETLNAGWLPLFTLALLRLQERQTLGRGVTLGLAFAATALFNFYYGLFALLLGAVLVAQALVRAPGRLRWGRFWATAGAGAGVATVLVGPVLRLLVVSMEGEDAVVTRDPDFVWQSLLNHNMTDLVALFHPGRFYSPDLKAMNNEELVIVTYLGWVALALAALGVRSRPRLARRWVLVTAVFLVFALGPYLYVYGQYVRLDGRPIPLPFLAFFQAVPLFSRISHPFRFVVGAQLGLALLAGLGAMYLLEASRGAQRQLATAGILAGVLVEVLLASPAPWPLGRASASVPEAYELLPSPAEGPPGAVLDLPVAVPNLERAVYLYWQTSHGRPGAYGLNEPVPARLAENPLTSFLMEVERGRILTLPRILPDLELVAGGRLLADIGFDAVVVHEDLLPAPKRDIMLAVLQGVFGPPVRVERERISVFATRAPQAAGRVP